MCWARINNYIWGKYPYPGKYPLPSAVTVFPATFILSFLCIVIGFAIHCANYDVKYVEVGYNHTNCAGSQCKLTFHLTQNWTIGRPISIFYRIRGFPNSHRRFQSNECKSQLMGEKNWRTKCEPFIETESIFFGLVKINKWWQQRFFNFSEHIDYEDVKDPKTKMFIAPMGAKANSMFNDTFHLSYDNGQRISIPFSQDGIMTRFEKIFHMSSSHKDFRRLYTATAKPRYWKKHITQLKDGFQNIDFLVWMRPEINENFIKIYRYIHPDVQIGNNPKGMLPVGNYELTINNNWGVDNCRIWKTFILFQPSWFGNEDFFLHRMFWLVGSVYFIVGAVMLIIHKKRGLSLEEVAKMAEEDDQKTK